MEGRVMAYHIEESIRIAPKYVAEIVVVPSAPCPPGCQPIERLHDVAFNTRAELFDAVEAIRAEFDGWDVFCPHIPDDIE